MQLPCHRILASDCFRKPRKKADFRGTAQKGCLLAVQEMNSAVHVPNRCSVMPLSQSAQPKNQIVKGKTPIPGSLDAVASLSLKEGCPSDAKKPDRLIVVPLRTLEGCNDVPTLGVSKQLRQLREGRRDIGPRGS